MAPSARARAGGGDGSITIDATRAEAKMRQILAAMPKELRGPLRKELATAAKIIVQAQRQRVKGLTTTSSGSHGATNARAMAKWAAGRSMGPMTQRRWEGLRKRSGLRAAAAASVRVVSRSRGTNYQLTVKSEGSAMPSDQRELPSHMNRGKWRHPIMGNREAWAEQSVEPGWFDKPGEEKAPEVAQRVEAALEAAIKSLPS